jgi:hypothetical protein
MLIKVSAATTVSEKARISFFTGNLLISVKSEKRKVKSRKR